MSKDFRGASGHRLLSRTTRRCAWRDRRKALGWKRMGTRQVLRCFSNTLSIGAEVVSHSILLHRQLPTTENAWSRVIESAVCPVWRRPEMASFRTTGTNMHHGDVQDRTTKQLTVANAITQLWAHTFHRVWDGEMGSASDQLYLAPFPRYSMHHKVKNHPTLVWASRSRGPLQIPSSNVADSKHQPFCHNTLALHTNRQMTGRQHLMTRAELAIQLNVLIKLQVYHAKHNFITPN